MMEKQKWQQNLTQTTFKDGNASNLGDLVDHHRSKQTTTTKRKKERKKGMYQTTTTTKQTIFILRGPLKEKQREQTRAPSAVTKAVVSGLRYTSTTNVIIFSLLEQCLGLLSS